MPSKDESRQEIAFKNYIYRVTEELRHLLYLDVYELGYVWKLEETKECNDGVTHATVEVVSKYLNINITIYKILLERWKQNRTEEIMISLLHEFCHALTWDTDVLAEKGCNASEFLRLQDDVEKQTQHICRIIARLIMHPKKRNFWERGTK